MRAKARIWATRALESSQDNPKQAVSFIIRQARRDVEVRTYLIKEGSRQLVMDYFRVQRNSAMSMARGRVAVNLDNPEVSKRIATRFARRMFWDEYTLFGMKPIREATRKDLLESANNRQSQANGEIRLAKFERMVASKLSSNRIKVNPLLLLKC